MRRLSLLARRAGDAELLLGSDIHATALEGYGLLKVTGHGEGLETMRKQLGARWRNRGSDTADKVPAEQAEPA